MTNEKSVYMNLEEEINRRYVPLRSSGTPLASRSVDTRKARIFGLYRWTLQLLGERSHRIIDSARSVLFPVLIDFQRLCLLPALILVATVMTLCLRVYVSRKAASGATLHSNAISNVGLEGVPTVVEIPEQHLMHDYAGISPFPSKT